MAVVRFLDEYGLSLRHRRVQRDSRAQPVSYPLSRLAIFKAVEA
jgi:hypothetical protein